MAVFLPAVQESGIVTGRHGVVKPSNILENLGICLREGGRTVATLPLEGPEPGLKFRNHVGTARRAGRRFQLSSGLRRDVAGCLGLGRRGNVHDRRHGWGLGQRGRDRLRIRPGVFRRRMPLGRDFGRFPGRFGDSQVVLLNQRLVIITPSAPNVDNPVELEPIGNGLFRYVAPVGGGPVGEVVRFVEEGGRVVRMITGDSYVDRVKD